MTDLISEIKTGWSQFDLEAVKKLEPLYSPSVTFIEPAGEIKGREAVFDHFRASCANLIECRFLFNESMEIRNENQACLVWDMTFRHRKLNGGKQIVSNGITLLQFDEQIRLHRDWFDLGQAVYENLPLMGSAVRFVKGKMHAHSAS